MQNNKSSKKIVKFPGRNIQGINMSKRNKDIVGKKKMRVIAITSGKGGVGKTNIVANLGYALCKQGKRVIILDADLGLGNLDILLGIVPKCNMSHVIRGEKSISDIIIEGPGNIQILPASSGIQEHTKLGEDQKEHINNELGLMSKGVDILLIDTAAGISSNVMYFNLFAHEIIIVVSPEPTSITDAYALMKVLSLKYSERNFKLMVNLVNEKNEAYEIFRQLNLVSDRFLDVSLEYLGCVLYDENLVRGVRRQRIVSDLYPDSHASKCFTSLALNICNSSEAYPVNSKKKLWNNIFWRNGD